MKLISWNIQWCRGVDGRVDPARIARTVKEMADADAICFQEVARNYPALPGSKGEDQFALLAAEFPGYTPIAGIAVDVAGSADVIPIRNKSETRRRAADSAIARQGEVDKVSDLLRIGIRRQFGNLLLSRLPVRQAYRHLLPWPADPAHADMQRVAIEAVLESEDGPLRVTTTHLAYYSLRQRAAQIEALRDLHAQAHAHEQPPQTADAEHGPFHWLGKPSAGIVTGDFNCEPHSAEHARMLAPFDEGTPAFHDAWQAMHPGRPHATTIGLYDRAQWPQPFCCDFMFVSADLAPRIRGYEINLETRASDHQPALLTLA